MLFMATGYWNADDSVAIQGNIWSQMFSIVSDE